MTNSYEQMANEWIDEKPVRYDTEMRKELANLLRQAAEEREAELSQEMLDAIKTAKMFASDKQRKKDAEIARLSVPGHYVAETIAKAIEDQKA